MKSWTGLEYVLDGIIILGRITRETGFGPWQAWLFSMDHDPKLLDDTCPTAEDAQRAIENACADI